MTKLKVLPECCAVCFYEEPAKRETATFSTVCGKMREGGTRGDLDFYPINKRERLMSRHPQCPLDKESQDEIVKEWSKILKASLGQEGVSHTGVHVTCPFCKEVVAKASVPKGNWFMNIHHNCSENSKVLFKIKPEGMDIHVDVEVKVEAPAESLRFEIDLSNDKEGKDAQEV